ncbi:M48 family metallopeptidase [Solilutibacter pythonis]|uniref:M48 family metallopeptidase n=1 Tax=Solilutibacter pythonis TaxID=2483112 RepID=UPI003CCC6C3D
MHRPVLLAAIVIGMAACATTTSPTGRTQRVGAQSQQELDRMGEEAFAKVKAQKPLSPDARQRAYVNCVVNAVVRQLPTDWQQYRWENALFKDDSPNAFALPGGKVGLYTGIFKVARNQDQLAAVVAHEIGHVVSKHHDERITRQTGTQVGLGILGALVGSAYGQGMGELVAQGGGLAAQSLILLPNNRTQESEADVVGQQLMARAGFDPRQAEDLWRNMISAGGNSGPRWLSTHPDPESRLREMSQRAAGLMPEYERARNAGRRPNCG